MDNSATSFPKPPGVTEAMVRYATELGASAGRGAYREAVETGKLLQQCREKLCALFHSNAPDHFIFTLNCSDALNLAIKGLLGPGRGGHVICTEADHNSVLRPLRALSEQGLVETTAVRLDPVTASVDPDAVRRAIRPDTRLIVSTHVSNVCGAVQDVRAIGAIARAHGIPFLVDAAQSVGHLPIDVERDNIDLMAAPGHKGLLGPLGTGFLYLRPGMEDLLQTVREGGTGSQSEEDRHPQALPDKYEAGSHNAIGIAGLLEGVKWLLEQTVERVLRHEEALMRLFLEGIQDAQGLRLYGPATAQGRSGVFSVRVDGMTPLELAHVLEDRYGILTRPGLHCAPWIHRHFGTLTTGGTTRLSFGPFLTEEDVRTATRALREVAVEAFSSV